MAYIYLDDLEEILPVIMNSWIDEDDESWEWIFKEIKNKSCIGERLSGKGKKKDKKKVDIDTLAKRLQDLNKEVEEMHREFINTKNNVTALEVSNKQLDILLKDMRSEISNIRCNISETKSMAEIAKRRTEVDYSKYNKPISYGLWSDCKKVIETCERFGATKEELEQLDLIMSKYIRNPAKTTEPLECCTTCKHHCDNNVFKDPCISCQDFDCWEAKDNG